MNRWVVSAVVVVLVAAVGGFVVIGGLSPATTFSGGDTRDSGTGGVTTTPDTAATTQKSDAGYTFTIERVTECGTTCRDVTARLVNDASESREDVRVTTRMYADENLLWQGNQSVGRLDAGEAYTSTKRVKLGFSDAMAIRNNDGYVTIVTVVRAADGTVRFEDRRKVA